MEKIDFTEFGEDTTGKRYNTLDQMWSHEVAEEGEWYEKGARYWENIDSSINGMLGGFAAISDIDISGSRDFLREFLDLNAIGKERAIDCGAGIGRITKNFLATIFDKVDLLEQNASFLEKAKEELAANNKVGEFFCSGMQSFDFGDNKYDVIWVQWVTGHLTDADFIAFLQKCKKALAKNGLIILKENATNQGFIVDKSDSSITRSDKHLRAIFTKSGLTLVKTKLQGKFPKELLPVRMYALR